MKGLIIKDLLEMKKFRISIFLYLLLTLLFLLSGMAGLAGIFAYLIFTSLTFKIVLSDMQKNNARLIFSWPFTRREYIAEKYGFSLGVGFLTALCTSLSIPLFSAVDFFQAFLIQTFMVIVYVSIMLPLYFRFQNQASIIQVILTVALLIPAPGFFDHPLAWSAIHPVVLAVLSLMLLTGSWIYSLHVLQYKRF